MLAFACRELPRKGITVKWEEIQYNANCIDVNE